MRTLGLMIVFFLFASAFASAQSYCDCYSYMYVNSYSGEISAFAYSENDYCFDACYVDVSMDVSDDSQELYYGSDNGDTYASVQYDGYVLLSDTYVENSSHYVEGYDDYYDYFTDFDDWSDEVIIPGAPTIYADSVSAPGGSLATIHYFASPPVLVLADMLVGTDYSTTNSPNDAQMPFDQNDIPYGATTFSFRGFMYGYSIPPSSYPIVVRTRTLFSPVYGTRIAACDERGEVQGFQIQAFETSDSFTYTVPYTGVTDLSLGGVLNIITDKAADCQFSIGVAPNLPPPTGTNEVRDVLFNDLLAPMVQPAQTFPIEQSPYYQSLDNSWAYYVAPNAWGQLCTTFWIDGDNIGVEATSICLDTNLP